MKKLFFVVLALSLTIPSFAGDEIYVLFTSVDNTDSEPQGVWRFSDENYNTALYRHPPIDYTLFSRPLGYYFKFHYLNRWSEPNRPIITKPVDFLNNTMRYIDWDVPMTKAEAKEKYLEIELSLPIYFIDRRDTENGMMKLVPVMVIKSRY